MNKTEEEKKGQCRSSRVYLPYHQIITAFSLSTYQIHYVPLMFYETMNILQNCCLTHLTNVRDCVVSIRIIYLGYILFR